jgi:hypothetical protein
LKGVAGGFTSHVTPGQPVQLLVHHGYEFSQRLLIPHAPSLEQLSYFMRRNIRQTNLSIKGTEANYIPVPTGQKKLPSHYSFRLAFPL